ncbi:hypothetical protein MPPM_0775 [Methylorubrum populi]|uniref:Bacteriophage protein n=1 Tax=Methylorubrum populi TaxID=223967 RepID=A0A160PDR1_9HYPH|nr:hypothetical protein [Methylorubrum populi]BAU89380.1 hypothetical protein MPPM_0775 [Methylorubrum populi]
MAEQYLRTVRLFADGREVFSAREKTGEAPGALRIRFQVQQMDASKPNVCSVIVTNPAPSSVKTFMQERKKISLSVGYQNHDQVVFKGEIIQTRSGREDITDTYMHVIARSMDRARNYATVNQALAAGHTYRDRIDVAVKAMREYGMEVGHIADLGNKKFPRNYIAFGMAKDLLREVCEGAGASWSIQNNVFQVVKNDQALPNSRVVLNSNTGLIGRPVQTIQGVEGRALLNPMLKPGGLVEINEKSVEQATINPAYRGEQYNSMIQRIAADGVYKLYVVEHIGDTRGLEFYTDFIGIANGDPISKALASRGISDAEGA